MKHTPAPWIAVKGRVHTRINSPNIGCSYPNGDIPQLASVHRHLAAKGLKVHEVDEEEEANARLIACAPELLEAVINRYVEASKYIEFYVKENFGYAPSNSHHFDNLIDERNNLEKIIKKATGMSIEEVIK